MKKRFSEINLFILGIVLAVDILFVLVSFIHPRFVSFEFVFVHLLFMVICIYAFIASVICLLFKVGAHVVKDKRFYVENSICLVMSILLFLLTRFEMACLIGYYY